MKASLAWLNEFLPEALTASVAAERLRRAGFDVPSVTRVGGIVTNVVVARVEAVEKHPNADKLRVCRVFDGKDRWNVVCGAPNVVAGGVYPLARLGATLPGDLKIEARALRGVDSQGMMCSARELGLSDEHAGLFELPADAPLGESIVAALGLDDEILEVEITPNRPDALSHWGLARELAAAGGRPLDWKPPRLPKAPVRKDAVRIEEAAACSRYIGRLLEGVRVGPSPLWLRLRLERCGLRSINNVVDVTNYVLLELGHPLHAFDRAKLSEARVVVRRGRAGETLEGLDGVVRPVDGALVVADAAVSQALAGVMGGRPSSVTAETTALFLESAVFLPAEIRRARGRWNLSTESSYRFERGTDPTMAEAASRRAVQLILETGGGRLT
ncbi:MAG TPA: phenylalanine--tRNA ligase subunit beta, partial [Elusimicrobiota bacterium]|nr:phenylalanine--tRNA ligase subunit beta [Elusimicrobiota bacterium]